MPRSVPLRRLLALPVSLAFIAAGAFAGTTVASAADPEPFVTATPKSITTADLTSSGVRIQGRSLDTKGPIQRQDIKVTGPDGKVAQNLTYFNPKNPDDGTFDVVFKQTADKVQVGTYTVDTAGFAGQASLAKATTTFKVTDEPVTPSDPPATISVDPKTITPDAFRSKGVQASGLTHDNGASINRSNLVLTSPSGKTASYFDLTGDGTFNVNIKPKGDVDTTPLEAGTYTLTATSLLFPDFTATTTFTVAGDETPPPASVTVDPKTVSQDDFVADGVSATGRTFDSDTLGDNERSQLLLTSPSGLKTRYNTTSADGTYDVLVKPKGDVATDPIETGTWTLKALSLTDRSFSATTTFQVTATVVPPEARDPEANATPAKLTQSEFLNGGVNLTGFTKQTPGPLTRQRIQVLVPGTATPVECADFTGDGTYDVQVYPKNAPAEGPDGQRACDLAAGGVPLPGQTPTDPAAAADPAASDVVVGVYQVKSFGFISEDAIATTTFEVVADAVDGGDNGNGNGNGDGGTGGNAGTGGNGNGNAVDNGQPGNGFATSSSTGGNGVLPNTGAGSILPLLLGLGLLVVGLTLTVPANRIFGRRPAGRHIA